MMFPTANSSIIRNEDGEVLGWDSPSLEDIDWEGDIEDREDADPATCEHDDKDMKDRREGNAALEEMPTSEAIYWECIDCHSEVDLDAEDWKFYFDN